MRLLLDTHLVLWWQADSPKLPAALPKWIEDADSVYVSQASLWEIAVKTSLGKLEMDVRKFASGITRQGFEWLDIRNDHLLAVAELPLFDDHRDPFDRLLVAQSRCEPMLFLTADSKLVRYGEQVRLV